jgi:hypothetical protein
MFEGSVAYIGEDVGISCVGCCCGEANARKLGVTQLKSPMSTRSNFSYLHRLAESTWDAMSNLLLKTEVLESAKAFFLCLPDAVDDILDVQNIVCLAVARIAKGHARRVHLRDGSEGKMRWPRLDEYHVAGQDTSSVCATCCC